MIRRALLIVVSLLAVVAPVAAHPAPFSYLDVVFRDGRIDGTLVVHVIDVAHELDVSSPDQLLDMNVLGPQRQKIAAILAPRITLRTDHRLVLEWTDVQPLVRGPGAAIDASACRASSRAR